MKSSKKTGDGSSIVSSIKTLWRISALPIITVLLILIALGIYLQSVSDKIQSNPLTINVKADKQGNPGQLDSIALEVTEEDLPDINLPSAPLQKALAKLKNGQFDQGARELQSLLDTDENLRGNPQVIIATAKGLVKAKKYQEALDLLETLSNPGGYAATVHFNKGLIWERMGKKKQAETEYSAALKLRPNYYEASFALGTLYLSLGGNGQAISVLENTLKLGSGKKRAKTFNNLAIAYTNAAMYQNAEKAYLEAINLVPQDLKARMNLARLYREQLGEDKQSQNLYREILRLDDKYAPAYFGLAMLNKNQGNSSEAQRLLEKAITYNPGYEEARKQLALLLFKQNKVDEAKSQLRWLMENRPEYAGSYFTMGRIEYSQRHYKKASDYYRKSYALSGETHLESLNNLGLSLKKLGNYEKAKQALLTALEKKPDYSNALYNLGLLYLDQEEYSQAQASFEKVVSLDPESASAWYNLGYVYSLRDLTARSIEAYQRALKIEPSKIKARLNLAVQYKKGNQLERAIQQYKLVLALNPSYDPAWFNLGLAQKELGNLDEAVKSYREAVQLDPDDIKYRKNLALLYSSLGSYDKAIFELSDALEIHPDSSSLRYALALQYKKKGDNGQALKELNRVVTLHPKYLKAWLAKADILSDQNNHSQAAAALEKALATGAQDSYTHYQLGKEYYALKRYTQAVTQYEESLLTIKNNPWIYYHLGKARQALGEEDKAQADFDRSLALDPEMGRLIAGQLENTDDSVASLTALVKEYPHNTKLRRQLAELLKRNGSLEEALAELHEVIQIDPEDTAAWLDLGGIYLEEEDYIRAAEALLKARTLSPADGSIALAYGKVLFLQGALKDAVPPLQLATKTLNKPLTAFRLLGELYYDLKDYPAAAQAYGKAKTIDPEDGKTVLNLGKAFYRHKNYQKARAEFDLAKQLLPDYAWADIWLGRAYNRLKEYDKAKAIYLDALKKEPNFIQGYISLGDLAVKLKNTENAIKYYKKALEIDPLHQGTKTKLERLTSG